MRRISRPLGVIATVSLTALLLAGCSEIQEVNNAVDKVQACAEATRIGTTVAGKVVGLANDPAAVEKALNEASNDLKAAADKAGNTTLQEAINGLAESYRNLSLDSVNNAVDSAQKAVTDTTRYLADIAKACG
ncbi:hypothetical protein [Rhizohabitans arisaemae]|uniref:hypothetical protein n=1 Tax=Rhizohabitans arisaemae TaxID=2720610 RepID=UPI0024B0890C|nr:hypothetical protein [Rhizohabitans arisaemae]